ncbi:MAG: hypothetical protein JSU77_05305 [Fidelibacterota bacterium]|nr:MAG: hypothetical protein JSU77_05305 [Candidatus Neomarinimicrobiota bacterium]
MSQDQNSISSVGRGIVLFWILACLVSGLPGQVAPRTIGLRPVEPPGRDAVTLFILDFDNLPGDARLDWLSRALKDMVLLRLEEEPRIVARDAGDITPFLEARVAERAGEARRLASNNLLLMGAYRRQDARLVVDLQLLDMRDWSSLRRESLEALYSDIPQLNELLVEKVLSMVKGVEFFSGIDLEAPPEKVERPLPPSEAVAPDFAPADEYGRTIPQVQEDLTRALKDLEEAMDSYSGYRQEPSGTFQSEESYYRDFQLEGFGALPEEKVRHTELFEDVLRRVADNPYSADIGDLSLEVDPYDDNRVYISIPVSYRVKQALVEDMLYSLPYVATREERRLRTIRYDKSKFNFSTSLIDRIARGDYRVVPVVQLLDPQGVVRAVLVDSPDMSWERYFPRVGVTVVRQKRFVPLMAITTSGFSVDVRLETSDVDVFYEFDIDVNRLTSYARVEVRFMKENQLLGFLQSL